MSKYNIYYMQKIETIWHHLLWSALEKGIFQHTQKDIAREFGYSLSTVNLAIKSVESVGGVKISGKFFNVSDPKKLLFFWATHRTLSKDIIYRTHVDQPVLEIEGLIPADAILGCYTAGRMVLGEAPADYSKVCFYFDEDKLDFVKKRFPPLENNNYNLFVLKTFPEMLEYGNLSSLPQTFVDLWNLDDWYAKDFLDALERKIDDILP